MANSTPTKTGNNKLTYSTAMSEKLHAIYGSTVRVILIGHDRGC